MIKEWNRKHSSFLSSFHIEVMVLRYGEFSDDYAWHTYKVFDHFSQLIQYKIPAPSGLGGYVDDYLTYTARDEAKRRIETAKNLALLAWFDSYNGRNKESIERFRKLYGERFPSYG